jgi:hypothetical protein
MLAPLKVGVEEESQYGFAAGTLCIYLIMIDL